MIGLRGPLIRAEGCCRRCGGHDCVQVAPAYAIGAMAIFRAVGEAGPLRQAN